MAEGTNLQLKVHHWSLGGKVYGLIIDGGSCINMTSRRPIDKVEIPTKEVPILHSLQWLGISSKATASRLALISFSIGPFCGEVL